MNAEYQPGTAADMIDLTEGLIVRTGSCPFGLWRGRRGHDIVQPLGGER